MLDPSGSPATLKRRVLRRRSFSGRGSAAHMVVLNKIYTRTGDAGLTALGIGERVPKHSLRIASYGTVDETNAFIGLARLSLAAAPKLDAMLGRVQNDLFDLGADLTTPERVGKPARERLRISEQQVERLEADI